jgi:hypothetical protein
MKKLTVEAAIEAGLKIGAEVWIKGLVESITKDKQPLNITFGEHWAKHYWCWEDIEIYLPEATTEPQPEAALEWQPKEGDKVWIEDYKATGRIAKHPESDDMCVVFYDGNVFIWIKLESLGKERFTGFTLEPYNNQDKTKIDFSVPGQWLHNGSRFVHNSGTVDGDFFFASYLGDGIGIYVKIKITSKWRIVTPEQMKPLLLAMATIMENRTD